ncbi:MAG: preprotein translocase subunit SecG [bacterium]|nr:preprotein translocase subunit SecG [bacterium]
MHTFLVVLHIMVCLILVLVVLLQRGKGGDVGAALGGGGSNTVFGSRGAGNFLTKLTTGSAVIFMLTSLSLAYLGNHSSNPLDLGEDVTELEAAPDPEAEAGETPSAGALEEIDPGPSANALEEIPVPESQPEPEKSE